MASRIMKGTVVSTKMNKTVVVQVEFSKVHPVYGRRYKMHTKLKAHYEGSDLSVGDMVTIQEVAPISKSKNWIIKADRKAKVTPSATIPEGKVTPSATIPEAKVKETK